MAYDHTLVIYSKLWDTSGYYQSLSLSLSVIVQYLHINVCTTRIKAIKQANQCVVVGGIGQTVLCFSVHSLCS